MFKIGNAQAMLAAQALMAGPSSKPKLIEKFNGANFHMESEDGNGAFTSRPVEYSDWN